ncbi:MAG: serine O-acetyltransferase [Kiritimatiellae bacterium]|nr:serine O-acetyltransferase [Kiritimatiellia bacterium]
MNPFHADHYCIFLYWLSRSLFEADPSNRSLADRVFYLNRMLNNVDLYYEVQLPDIFFVGHPLGSVMGRAKYGTHFSFCQQCTVGNNKGTFPVIGDHVKMFANSMILGKSNIGDHVWISANSYVKDQDVPPNSIVFGQSPHLLIKPRPSST